MLADDAWIVDVVDRMQLDSWIVVHKFVELAGAHQKCDDELSGVNGFLLIGDDAGFDQSHDSIGNHFRLNAQVLLALQGEERGIGDGADPELKSSSIGNKRRNVFADLPLDFAKVGRHQLHDRGIALDNPGEGIEMDPDPRGAGKVPVHLGDHDGCGLRSGLGVIGGEAIAAEALLIGRSDLQQHYIYGQYFLLEEPWNFGEEAGSERTATLLHGLSGGSAEKESVEVKAAFHAGL